MAIQSVVTTQTDFTGEFPLHNETVALWRFNESQPNDNQLKDISTNNHHFTISNWSGTSASLVGMCQVFLGHVLESIFRALYFCTLLRLPRYRLVPYLNRNVLQTKNLTIYVGFYY